MSRIIEKYIEYFPPVLFFCSDDHTSMHFILSLKHLSDDQQGELTELLHHCGAKLSFNVEDATDYSAVIVDHDEVVNIKAPAFTFKYLQDCMKKVKVQDISEYRQDATRHISNNVTCMDVVYYRTQSWDSVLTKAEKQWFEKNTKTSGSTRSFEPQASSSRLISLSSVNERLSSDEDSDEESNKNANKVQTVQKSITNGKKKPVDENKTQESSLHKIQSLYVGSESNEKTAVESQRKKDDKCSSREAAKTSSSHSSKWSFLDEFHPASSDEENARVKSMEQEKNKKFFDFDGADEDLYNPIKDKKHSRLPYSHDEQEKILKYIKHHNEYSRTKGREVWMVMERRKICPNRTWQSMKEHFMKKILFNLDAFDFLTDSEKRKIKENFC